MSMVIPNLSQIISNFESSYGPYTIWEGYINYFVIYSMYL